MLGIFQVNVPEAPATFTTSDLTISPAEANTGESVTITVTVTNTGDLTGTCELCLKIDNAVAQTKEITLTSGASQKVTFTATKDTAGIYQIDVGKLSGSFVVKEEAPLVAEEEISITPAPAITPTPVPTPTSRPNWWLISGIIAGVVAVGLASYFLIRKRRKAKG